MTILYVYMDGNLSPTFQLTDARGNTSWRPPKEDMSWRIDDQFGRVVDEYHPHHSVKEKTMPLIIKVRLRAVYGRDNIYPVNPAAFGLAAVAGTITLSPSVLNIAKTQLGAVVLVEDGSKETLEQMLKVAA